MKILNNLYWLIFLLFTISCARQSSPTGGPKDTIPPTLVRSIPQNEETNFKGKNLELIFSELISLSNPKEQIIITPSIGKDYDISARNNKVILSYETDLADSTTYSFNFREAVMDVTERNPALNLKIAVSTGSYIDSLSVKGKVANLLEQKPLKDATVALHPYIDTFNILKHTASYFTKTDENGVFEINNLKPGSYIIYAVTDQNKNLVVDSKNEAYAFLVEPIKLDSSLSNINLKTVKLDTRALKLTSARPYNTYFNIRTSKNLKSATITAADSTYLHYAFGQDRQNIQLYNSFGKIDSLAINIILEDSIDNRVDTTVYVKFTEKEVTPEKFDYEVINTRLLAHKGDLHSEIKFTKPLKEVDFDSLYYKVDSLTLIPFSQQDLDYDVLSRTLKIKKKIDSKYFILEENTPFGETPSVPDTTKNKGPKKQNQLYFGKGAFISAEQDSSTQKTVKITPQRFEDLGVIIVEVYVRQTKVITQLLDGKKNIVASVKHKEKITFEDLPPQDYQLRIILDTNGNGVWDPGNYLKKQEPEEIIYYQNEKDSREIKLKANFEIGPLLITY